MTALTGVISYPIPLYANVPIHAEYYQPSRFVISAVVLGQTTTVTTSVVHNYVIGQEVRLIIPATYGCFQLNETKGFVLSIPSTTQVEISIDSSLNVDAYIASTNATAVAQILAIGDVNTGQINGGQISSSGIINLNTYIPGSFLNISPL